MSTSHPLPPPRSFMTSLFNTLTASSSSLSSSLSPQLQPHNPSHIPPRLCDSRSTATNEKANRRGNENANQKENPLKNVEAEKKALLMTLHVIFPPPLLLQALDLLDRGGVERIVFWWEGEARGNGYGEGEGKDLSGEERVTSRYHATHAETNQTTGEGAESSIPPQAHIQIQLPLPLPLPPAPHAHAQPPTSASNPSSPTKSRNKITLHQVRSSQPSKWNSSHSHSQYQSHSHATTRSNSRYGVSAGMAPSDNIYTVHLDAWNCTCAAFTYSAFPALPTSSISSSSHYSASFNPTSSPLLQNKNPQEKEKETPEEEKWQYGGTTAKDPQVPICKHLVACLLGERWAGVLGGYVGERVVGREEMAGLFV
ncbi:hypothetical protein SBOR_1067 [Sclerotinia borealis F-4128]|uniref:SWIM-type domain-containing protein n=1 Tax=Sclerotinia borealis (strain F-4128) TaxID=1432307 RepID=W9CVG9_SCLBF|nr:hypothetical protein SBOR_1067 [Sclerotinia borealis F-4128]